MLEWRRDRCNDGEGLFGVRRFATNVTDLLVLSKCGELRMPQAVAVGRVGGLLKSDSRPQDRWQSVGAM